jgi:L-methionine (R)-S-oxide reductase
MRAPVMSGKNESKPETYQRLEKEILAVLEGEDNEIARMATIACLLHDAFENRIWTGFYLVDNKKPNELVVGPYHGTLGCLRIPFGKGVCGTAAQEGQTQIVKNVHDFSGHIACDARSVSEIVVPVFDENKNLLAVLDIDSEAEGSFDEIDKQALENLVAKIFAV